MNTHRLTVTVSSCKNYNSCVYTKQMQHINILRVNPEVCPSAACRNDGIALETWLRTFTTFLPHSSMQVIQYACDWMSHLRSEEGYWRRRGPVLWLEECCWVGRVSQSHLWFNLSSYEICCCCWASRWSLWLLFCTPEAQTAACNNKADWGWDRGWRNRFSLGGIQESVGWTR